MEIEPKEKVDKSSVNGTAKKPLTREQKRQIERISQEAMQRFKKFCDSFSEWLYDTVELTDELVALRIQESNAKWQVYCRSMNLTLESRTTVKEFCEELYKAYKSELTRGASS
jgi:4-alpha-glucanotransferase